MGQIPPADSICTTHSPFLAGIVAAGAGGKRREQVRHDVGALEHVSTDALDCADDGCCGEACVKQISGAPQSTMNNVEVREQSRSRIRCGCARPRQANDCIVGAPSAMPIFVRCGS